VSQSASQDKWLRRGNFSEFLFPCLIKLDILNIKEIKFWFKESIKRYLIEIKGTNNIVFRVWTLFKSLRSTRIFLNRTCQLTHPRTSATRLKKGKGREREEKKGVWPIIWWMKIWIPSFSNSKLLCSRFLCFLIQLKTLHTSALTMPIFTCACFVMEGY
jgi:hypothetical protein